MDLTNDQAQALFDAGCFCVLTGLPEGSEVGIDGTYHLVRRFSGFKFVPPGLHLITWSASSPGSSSGPSGIPIRHAFVKVFAQKERVVLSYDSKTEHVSHVQAVISDDSLKTLDKELAPYPFEGLEKWKSLTTYIDERMVEEVVSDGRVDGMTPVIGEEAEKGEEELGSEVDRGGAGLKFAQFRLKRSWKDGAVGEEVTRYSRDKSWLLGHVVSESLSGDPYRLLGQLQLAFVLLLHLSSYGGLTVYKRILPLFTRSSSILHTPTEHLASRHDVVQLFTAAVHTLAAQIRAIPSGSFETELPEFDLFYLDEIEALRSNLASTSWRERLRPAWRDLQLAGRTWRWDIDDLQPAAPSGDSDEEDEDGEYAPVVVEIFGIPIAKGVMIPDLQPTAPSGDSDEEDEDGEYAPVVVEM